MFLEAVDVSYWFLMSVSFCVCLTVAVVVVSSGGSGHRCCKRKSREDEVPRVADGQTYVTAADPASKADDVRNLDDGDANFLAELLTPMRPLSECHSRPYLYERSHDRSAKSSSMTVVHSFERKTNRSIVNTLTEQVQCRSLPIASSGALVSNSMGPEGAAETPLHDHLSSVHKDQLLHRNISTSSRGESTYEHLPPETLDCGGGGQSRDSVMTYAKLTTLSGPSSGTTVVSYTSLKKVNTNSYMSIASGPFTLLADDNDENAYNYSLTDCNMNSDLSLKPNASGGHSITRPLNTIWHSCERRSDLESDHYSTLAARDCNDRAMSGIYDTIQDTKYHTVCTTSPASTKQQHERKAKGKAEQEAAKRKTMTPDHEIELKTSTNEVF